MKKSSIILFLLLTNLLTKAQELPADSMLSGLFERDILLPVLIDSAIKNSPVVKRTENSISMWEENAKVSKSTFLNGLSFISSYNFGTTGDINFGKDYNSSSQFTNFRSSRGDRYNVGINLQMPLSTLLSKKHVARSSDLQIRMAEDEKENSILYVKQEVIRLYQEFKLSHKLVIAAGNNKQTAFVNFSMTQKSFLKGDADLEQFTRLNDIYNKTAMEYEVYINRFQTSFLQLQAYTGTQLAHIINQYK